MNFLEKDLEQIIYESDRELLEKKGLYIGGKLLRQVRIGNYGVADLVSVSRDVEVNYNCTRLIPYLEITVYELKKDKIGISAFLQALGYVKGISDYFERRNINRNVRYNIVLIGSSLDTNSSYAYLSDFVCSDRLSLVNYVYSYDINGIKFKSKEGYSLKDKGF